MNCTKSIITNGCGHSAKIMYKNCGVGHEDSAHENKKCYIKNRD